MPGSTTFTIILTLAVGLTWLVAIGWLVFVHRQRQWTRPIRWLAGLAGALVIMIAGGYVIYSSMLRLESPTPAATPTLAPISYIGTPEA